MTGSFGPVTGAIHMGDLQVDDPIGWGGTTSSPTAYSVSGENNNILTYSSTIAAPYGGAMTTSGVSSGKVYWELEFLRNSNGDYPGFGIARSDVTFTTGVNALTTTNTIWSRGGYAYTYNSGVVTGGPYYDPSLGNSLTLGFALNMDIG